MSYNISVINGAPSYESLPALKIVNFPAGNCYKPYTQVKPATDGKNLYIEFLVFESHPPKGSCVSAVFKSSNICLFIQVKTNKSCCSIIDNNGKITSINNKMLSHHFDGEDLQGIYWGTDITLPLEIIYDSKCANGETIDGNFFKHSTDETLHYGSLFPADFSKPLWDQKNLGEFEFISY